MLNLGEFVENHNINLKSGIIFGLNFINYFEIYQTWFTFVNFNLTSMNVDLNFPDIKYKSSLILTEFLFIKKKSFIYCV
jgi:hypothetical protein